MDSTAESTNSLALPPKVPVADKEKSLQVSSSSQSTRKPIKPRSNVWEHFEKVEDAAGVMKAKCRYCDKLFCGDTKKNGTSTLRSHYNACKNKPVDASQTQLNMKPGDNTDMVNLTTWKFDQLAIRDKIVKWVIHDELPFKVVESKKFIDVMNEACPRFIMPSRWTVSRDCFQLYIDERLKLKNYFKTSSQKLCLTTDTWTSNQNMNYMCITAHFIDQDWNVHKKILNFTPIFSHKGELIGKALEACLLEWGIRRVFTVTLDNASSNDTAIAYLKTKFFSWGSSIANCKFLHMRCVAHIINLVVQDGLKDLSPSIKWIRAAVKYIRASPARLNKFKELAEDLQINCNKSLKLDVATRWNSTYEMLSVAEQYERAFASFATIDGDFKYELESVNVRDIDWNAIRKMATCLKQFYDATIRVSGSWYITSNCFWTEISDLHSSIREWIEGDDLELMKTGTRMKAKFDKYWGDIDKMNKLIYIASIFDPREKLEAMDYIFCQIYGEENGNVLYKNVKDALFDLFKEYKNMLQPQIQASNESAQTSQNDASGGKLDKRPRGKYKSEYKKQKYDDGAGIEKRNELEIYLDEAVIDEDDDFQILLWWKVNAVRFPVLSELARDVLAVPISTVASESAFSTGGRILDAFRSSLTPRVVEALICAQDWLRRTMDDASVEEFVEDMEQYEKGLLTVGSGGNTSMTHKNY